MLSLKNYDTPDLQSNKALVSIIMPCYNSENYISDSIRSVIKQTYNNWELLICDDDSSDRSLSISKRFAELDHRITIVKNVYEKGAPGSRNSCLDAASGRYIAFLDSDDLWLSGKLEEQIVFMKENQIAFSYSYHELMDENGKFLGACKAPNQVSSKTMRLSNFIPCLTAVYDSNILGKVYQPKIKKRNDYALWLKILNGGVVDKAYCLPKVTAKYRVNQYGLSSNRSSAIKYFRRCLVEFGECSNITSFYFCFLYLCVVLVKKKFLSLYNKIVVFI